MRAADRLGARPDPCGLLAPQRFKRFASNSRLWKVARRSTEREGVDLVHHCRSASMNCDWLIDRNPSGEYSERYLKAVAPGPMSMTGPSTDLGLAQPRAGGGAPYPEA